MCPEGQDPSRELAELVVQLGRAAYADTGAAGLTAAQWTAIRFFARANRFSRTVSAFADYHATTRGTASQTVRSLVERGFLTRTRCDRDGRSVQFELTDRSRAALDQDPLRAFASAAARLGDARRRRLAGDLRQIRAWIAESQGRAAPGACALCGHLVQGDTGFQCGLMRERLDAAELDQLCVRFVAASPGD
jgi:DNA-binding MarR family transcriptional regulator